MLLLLPAYLFANSMHPTSSILYGTSRHRVLSVIVITEGLINLGLSLWLIRVWGLAGVALGTAIPMLIARLFVVPFYACRTIQLPYRTFLREALGPAVIPFIGSGLLAYLFMRLIPGQDVGSVILLGGIISVVYVTLTVVVLLVRDDELLPGAMRTRIEGLADSDGRSGLFPRILYIAYRFPPQGGGGVQRPVKTVKAWRKRGVSVAVLTATSKTAKLRDPTLLNDIPSGVPRIVAPDPNLPQLIRGWRMWMSKRSRLLARLLVGVQWLAHWFSVPDAAGGWFLPGLWQGWRAYRKFRPDVILVTGPPWTPFLVGGVLSRLTSTPLVLDYRDPWTATFLSVPRQGLGQMVSPLLERALLRCASGVTTAHRAVFRHLGAMLPPTTPRLWVPNGFDPDDFDHPTPVASEEDGKPFTLTYTGGFFVWRSPETLFRVLGDLMTDGVVDRRRFRIVLAGSVEPALEFCPEGSPLAEVVESKGYLPHRESIRLLQESTVNLVLEGELGGPNRHTPGKFYEVLYSGRPVLLLCPAGTTTALANRVGGCVSAHPDDANAIRSAVLKLYETWLQNRPLAVPRRESLLFYSRIHQAERLLGFLQGLGPSRAPARSSGGSASAAVFG
jgi:glycosyltransferase involved in cell wall biosynthesis